MRTLKIALALLLTAFTFGAGAQIQQNSFLIGGSMSFDYNDGKNKITTASGQTITRNEPQTTVFGLEPRIGYFIVDNFCAGLSLDFRITSSTADYPDFSVSTPDAPVYKSQTTTTTRLITGPFLRYYAPISNSVYFFGEGSFGGGLDDRTVSDPVSRLPQSVTVTNWSAGVGPGIDFFINDFVAFEALAKYNYGQSTFSAFGEKNSSQTNNIRFTLGLQFYFRAVEGGLKTDPGSGRGM